MARIKIEDLPMMEDIDAQETKGIFGGGAVIEEKPGSRLGQGRGRFGGLSQRGIVIVETKPGGLGQRGIIDDNTKPGAKLGGGLKGLSPPVS